MLNHFLKYAGQLENLNDRDSRLVLAAIDNALKTVIADDNLASFYDKLGKFLEEVGDQIPRGHSQDMKFIRELYKEVKHKVESPSQVRKKKPKVTSPAEEWEDVDSDFSSPESAMSTTAPVVDKTEQRPWTGFPGGSLESVVEPSVSPAVESTPMTSVPPAQRIPFIPALNKGPKGTRTFDNEEDNSVNQGLGFQMKDMFKNLFTAQVALESLVKTAGDYDRKGYVKAANMIDDFVKKVTR